MSTANAFQSCMIGKYRMGWRADDRRGSNRYAQLAENRPYLANLCPLSGWVEFAGFRENLAEAIGEAIESVSRRAIW